MALRGAREAQDARALAEVRKRALRDRERLARDAAAEKEAVTQLMAGLRPLQEELRADAWKFPDVHFTAAVEGDLGAETRTDTEVAAAAAADAAGTEEMEEEKSETRRPQQRQETETQPML